MTRPALLAIAAAALALPAALAWFAWSLWHGLVTFATLLLLLAGAAA